jgi:hypothetical protein
MVDQTILAKEAIDKVIRKSRVHLYKPIQVAEILYRIRTVHDIDPLQLEQYRNQSKQWRDRVTTRLVGNASTSSAKFQDNLFEENAVPPRLLAILSDQNTNGLVENYIYQKVKHRLSLLFTALEYIDSHSEDFQVNEFHAIFTDTPGLRRSVDKVFEILVFAYLEALTKIIDIVLEIRTQGSENSVPMDILEPLSSVFGISGIDDAVTERGSFFRLGVANASDRGLDIWSNLGLAVQVKHHRLGNEGIRKIVASISARNLIIACTETEPNVNEDSLSQIAGDKNLRILTFDTLRSWYDVAFGNSHKDLFGRTVLEIIREELVKEFPATQDIDVFLREREYRLEDLDGTPWSLT